MRERESERERGERGKSAVFSTDSTSREAYKICILRLNFPGSI